MPIDHPYLQRLKDHILSLGNIDVIIKDDNPNLIGLCTTLEDIFRESLRCSWDSIVKNIQSLVSVISNDKMDKLLTCWSIHQNLGLKLFLPAPVQQCIQHVEQCQKTMTNVGKERLFIRCCLNKCTLELFWRIALSNNAIVHIYYKNDSIFVDEINSEVLLSLLASLMKFKFNLNYKNSAFLDATWFLPTYKMQELVPSKRLGIELELIKTRLVVIDVMPGSVADEDGKFERGDIIDELFGESMRNVSPRHFSSLLFDYQGMPVYVNIIKCISNGVFYTPLIKLLPEVGLCRHELMNLHKQRLKEVSGEDNMGKMDSLRLGKNEGSCCGNQDARLMNEYNQFPLVYHGSADVGIAGSVEQIEKGIMEVKKNSPKNIHVLMDIGETDLIIIDTENSKKIIIKHSYPEISSCGRRIDMPLFAAYVAGDTTCSLAKTFTCYVFEADCEERAKMILAEIAKGFERTHWAV